MSVAEVAVVVDLVAQIGCTGVHVDDGDDGSRLVGFAETRRRLAMKMQKREYERLLEEMGPRPEIERIRERLRQMSGRERAKIFYDIVSESGDEGGRADLAGAAALLTEDIRCAATDVEEADLDVDLIAERIAWIDEWLDRLRVAAALLPWDAVDEMGRSLDEAVEAGSRSDGRLVDTTTRSPQVPGMAT